MYSSRSVCSILLQPLQSILYTVLSDVETNQWKITTLRQMAQKLGSKHLVHLASKMGMLYLTLLMLKI